MTRSMVDLPRLARWSISVRRCWLNHLSRGELKGSSIPVVHCVSEIFFRWREIARISRRWMAQSRASEPGLSLSQESCCGLRRQP